MASGDSYGRELFLSFVPSSARLRAGAVPLLSGALVARAGADLGGPVVEIELCPRAALIGALRAARRADAIVAVSVPAAVRLASPDASRRVAAEVVAAAADVHFDRPLVLVARALPLAEGASAERLSEGLFRDLEAGFTSFGFGASLFAADVEGLARVCAPLLEQDLGIELEIDAARSAGFDPALLLASLDDTLSRADLRLAAVRGAQAGDELGGGLWVVERASAEAGAPSVPSRVVMHGVLEPVVARALDDARTELYAFEATERWLQEQRIRGVGGRFLDVLAREG